MDDRAALDEPNERTERRRRERREIDAHRAELVEAVDRLNARSWRRDVLFAAIGALLGGLLTIGVMAAT